jgi:hypothetical protein
MPRMMGPMRFMEFSYPDCRTTECRRPQACVVPRYCVSPPLKVVGPLLLHMIHEW